MIPAYNNNETLLRLLNSIKQQNITFPIQVVVSDDASKFRLGETKEFKEIKKNLNIEWHYQEINLGVLSNAIFLAKKAKFKYAVFAQHDDYFIDNNFLKRSIEFMENNSNVGFVFGNAIFENSPILLMKTRTHHQEEISGIDFSKRFWSELMTSWTSVVFNIELLNLLGGFGVGYTVSDSWGKRLSAYSQEEGMAFLYLLSAEKNCIIDWAPVSVRGLPPTRFSTSTDHPGRLLKNDSLFFVYWNIYKKLSRGSERHIVIAQNALKQAINFGLNRSNDAVREYMGSSVYERKVIQTALIKNRLNRMRHTKNVIKEYVKYPLRIIYRKFFPKNIK